MAIQGKLLSLLKKFSDHKFTEDLKCNSEMLIMEGERVPVLRPGFQPGEGR